MGMKSFCPISIARYGDHTNSSVVLLTTWHQPW